MQNWGPQIGSLAHPLVIFLMLLVFVDLVPDSSDPKPQKQPVKIDHSASK